MWVRAQVLLTDEKGNTSGYIDLSRPEVLAHFDELGSNFSIKLENTVDRTLGDRSHPEITLTGRLTEGKFTTDGSL